MTMKRPNKADEADNVVLHFAIAGIVVLNGIASALLNLVILPFERRNEKVKERNYRERMRSILSSKTNQELRSMMSGFDKISRLNKSQLIELALSNSFVLSKLGLEDKL